MEIDAVKKTWGLRSLINEHWDLNARVENW